MRQPLVSSLVLTALVALFVAGCSSDQPAPTEPSAGTDAGVSGDLAGTATVSVSFDIKPGSCPNPLNPKSRGLLPVAIVGTPDFDVNDIDPSTLLIAGAIPPLRSHVEDVATAPVPEPDLPNIEILTFFAPRIGTLGGRVGASVRMVIRNTGTADINTSFPVGYYISADPVITTSDHLLIGGREQVAGLLAGQQKPVQLWAGAYIPNDAPTGNVFLGVIVDEFNWIVESDETDNTTAWPITISPAGAGATTPDPIIEAEDCACAADGPDGIDDLTMKFRMQEVIEILGALAPGDTRELTISGQLWDGTAFEGTDCVVVVGGDSGHGDDPDWKQ